MSLNHIGHSKQMISSTNYDMFSIDIWKLKHESEQKLIIKYIKF